MVGEIQLNYTGAQINAKLDQVETNRQNIANYIPKFFNSINVPIASWQADNTYEEYPYRAAIALSGITNIYFPEVIFSVTDAASGLFAPICETYNGGIYLYATCVPLAAITIPTIKCTRGS